MKFRCRIKTKRRTLKMEKRKERPLKNTPFTREQIRGWLEEYDLKDGKSIADFLKNSFSSFIRACT